MGSYSCSLVVWMAGWRRRRVAVALWSVCCGIACGAPSVPEPTLAQHVRAKCGAPLDDDYFLPIDSINSSNKLLDDTCRERFSLPLRAMKARSFSCGDNTLQEAYRFLWMPSYDPAVVISIRRAGEQWSIDAAQFENPRTGGQWWRVSRRAEHELANNVAATVLRSLAEAGFWTMPAWRDPVAQDGATWVIEGRLANGYRVVSRFTAEEKAFKDVGRAFFTAAGISLPRAASQ